MEIRERLILMVIKEIGQNKGKICEDILRSLKDWFGIEEATKAYIKGVEDTVFLVACDNEKPVGFISLKKHYPFSYEIYVMGIYKNWNYGDSIFNYFFGKGFLEGIFRKGAFSRSRFFCRDL